jgi:hypothetical protein
VGAGTQVAARAPDGSQLVFETEHDIGLCGASLTQLVSLWPGTDTFADHSSRLAPGGAFALFTGGAVTPHVLYLADDNDLALKGASTVEITFDLPTPGSQALKGATWEYWDSKNWHPFGDPAAPVIDGTAGLTRSGVIQLHDECTETAKTTVAGMQSYWIRCRMTGPLLPDFARQDATVKSIRINTVVERLFADAGGIDAPVDVQRLPPTAGLRPDLAFADASSLDLSKAFLPFGQAPRPGSALYIACDEAFSKPGAQVRLAIAMTRPAPQIDAPPGVRWEYWDGARWLDLILTAIHNPNIVGGSVLAFCKETTRGIRSW